MKRKITALLALTTYMVGCNQFKGQTPQHYSLSKSNINFQNNINHHVSQNQNNEINPPTPPQPNGETYQVLNDYNCKNITEYKGTKIWMVPIQFSITPQANQKSKKDLITINKLTSIPTTSNLVHLHSTYSRYKYTIDQNTFDQFVQPLWINNKTLGYYIFKKPQRPGYLVAQIPQHNQEGINQYIQETTTREIIRKGNFEVVISDEKKLLTRRPEFFLKSKPKKFYTPLMQARKRYEISGSKQQNNNVNLPPSKRQRLIKNNTNNNTNSPNLLNTNQYMHSSSSDNG